jgi:hypothetical protein
MRETTPRTPLPRHVSSGAMFRETFKHSPQECVEQYLLILLINNYYCVSIGTLEITEVHSCKGSGNITPHTFNLGIKWVWKAWFLLRSLHPVERHQIVTAWNNIRLARHHLAYSSRDIRGVLLMVTLLKLLQHSKIMVHFIKSFWTSLSNSHIFKRVNYVIFLQQMKDHYKSSPPDPHQTLPNRGGSVPEKERRYS